MYKYLSLLILLLFGFITALLKLSWKLSTFTTLGLFSLAFIPVTAASSTHQDFPDITFRAFSTFIENNFSSKITLATVLTILFSLMENPELLNLHFRQSNPSGHEQQRNTTGWIKVFSHTLVQHLGNSGKSLFKKNTYPDNFDHVCAHTGKKLAAMAQLLALSPYDNNGNFQGKVQSISHSNINPIRVLCPNNMVCLLSSCTHTGRSLHQHTKAEDIHTITLIKGSIIYPKVTLLSAKCPSCRTIYHVDHDIIQESDGRSSQTYLRSAQYLKVGQNIWVDRIFSSAVLKGLYSFHASTAAYTEFWNLSFGSINHSSSITLSRRHIWQAFIQESIRIVSDVSHTDFTTSPPYKPIYNLTTEAFNSLGNGGIIQAAVNHSCSECTQPYKATADAVHHTAAGAVLEGDELLLPEINDSSESESSKSSDDNGEETMVKMVVLDGIVMGPTVSIFIARAFILLFIYYLSIAHLMAAFRI